MANQKIQLTTVNKICRQSIIKSSISRNNNKLQKYNTWMGATGCFCSNSPKQKSSQLITIKMQNTAQRNPRQIVTQNYIKEKQSIISKLQKEIQQLKVVIRTENQTLSSSSCAKQLAKLKASICNKQCEVKARQNSISTIKSWISRVQERGKTPDISQ